MCLFFWKPGSNFPLDLKIEKIPTLTFANTICPEVSEMSIKDSILQFSVQENSHLNVGINTIRRKSTITVDKVTFPPKVSTCSRICNELHIIYITMTCLSVFVFITVMDLCL